MKKNSAFSAVKFVFSFEGNAWRGIQTLIGLKNTDRIVPVPHRRAPLSLPLSWAAKQFTRTTDTQWRHKSKIYEKLGQCGRWNMLRPYLKIWDWDWIFGRAVKTVSSLGVRSPWQDRNMGPVESRRVHNNNSLPIHWDLTWDVFYFMFFIANCNSQRKPFYERET